jgi:flagellar hook protein FlgE
MSQIHNAVFNTLGAVDTWMKTIGSNITGSTVTGYRGQQVEFGEVLNMQVRGGAKPTDGYGSVNPIQRADSGIRVTGIRTDFSQGSVTTDGEATHLAINGDAFFVVSRVPVPRSMDDLMFTRDGSFHFEFIEGPVAGTGTNRLVNKDGMFVMGYNTPVNDAVRPFGTAPEESKGTDLNAFSTVAANGVGDPGLGVQLQNMQLDAVRNPNLNNFAFTPQGMVQINGEPPRDLANNFANMHVSLAKFANPQGLTRKSGGAYFAYDVVAGQINAGTAGDARPGKIIGRDNTLTSGAIEQANTSINTVMPELTLAQKSFSAASKIISVGNTMIDDVNGLIR